MALRASVSLAGRHTKNEMLLSRLVYINFEIIMFPFSGENFFKEAMFHVCQHVPTCFVLRRCCWCRTSLVSFLNLEFCDLWNGLKMTPNLRSVERIVDKTKRQHHGSITGP